MLSLLTGDTLAWVLGGVLAIIAAIGAAFMRGRKGEADRTTARNAADYQKTRKEIDHADLGHGATDAQRIDRLREIADRRGGSGSD
jgi:hypothetical protein